MERPAVRFRLPGSSQNSSTTPLEASRSTIRSPAKTEAASPVSRRARRVSPTKGKATAPAAAAKHLPASRGRTLVATAAGGKSGKAGKGAAAVLSSLGESPHSLPTSRGDERASPSFGEVSSAGGAFGGDSDGEDGTDGGSEDVWGERSSQRTSSTLSRPSLSSASLGGAATRVVTSFRGVAVPEHKGPMPRVGHTAIMYNRNVYLFGGINAKGQYPSHLYRHEKRSLQWEEVRGLGVVPSGRANHSAVLVGDRMYVYGGHRNLEVFDDLFCFRLDAARWERIAVDKTQGPGPCFLHAAVYVPITDTMLVLGGFHQREHNTYLGHAFDVQNRVWSGIPGPAETNPQHLQLVTACFHSPRSAVIVLGIAEKDDAVSRSEDPTDMPTPFVYLLNIYSFTWSRVSTASSPESPIPFRLDVVWHAFLRDFIRMGGFYDEAQGNWYFPVNLGQLETALLGRGRAAAASALSRGTRASIDGGGNSSASTSQASGAGGRMSAAPRSQYGFFVLNLGDLTWAIVPTSFPKKLLAELAAKNRERASTRAIEVATAGLRKSSETNAGQLATRSGVLPPRRGRSVLHGTHLSITSLDGAGTESSAGHPLPQLSQLTHPQRGGNGGFVSGQAGQRPLDGARGTARRSVSALAPANPRQAHFPSDTTPTQDRFRTLLLYTVRGAPQFQRKYAFAAYRDASTKGKQKRLKPMKYLIMHGGLAPGEDYAMFMFTPVTTRADLHAVRRAGSFISYEAQQQESKESLFGTSAAEDDEEELRLLRELLVEERDREGNRAAGVRAGGRNAAFQAGATEKNPDQAARGDDESGVPPWPEGDPLVHIDNDIGTDFFHRKGDGGGRGERGGPTAAYARLNGDADSLGEDSSCDGDGDKESCLLPTLPCTRTAANRNRFAILYSTANSVKDPSLLPYANCPVAVLETEAEVMRWSEQHYLDSRKWIAAKVKEAVSQDKAARRARKKTAHQGRQQQQQMQQHGGPSGRNRPDGLVDSHSDDSDDSDNNDASAGAVPANGGGAVEQGMPVSEMAAAAAAADRAEKERRALVRDFFEKRGLDVFNLDQFLEVQAAAASRAVSGRSGGGSRGGGGGGGGDSSIASDASASLFLNAPGMERLRVNTKRHEEQQRPPLTVFRQQQQAGGVTEANALADLGSAMAYVLMHNSLAALQSDPTPEAATRRARIRWRFLRALVKTGEAAFLIYRASQEASKMRAVKVTSTPGLLLAPELHLIGPTRAYKVPSRPVPYALPRPVKQSTRYAEVTPSGMVVYHNMRHVK